MSMGRFEEAAEQMKKAIELDPYNLNYARNLGWIFYYEGGYEDAKSVLEGIIEINPVFSFVHFTLAMVYLEWQKRQFLHRILDEERHCLFRERGYRRQEGRFKQPALVDRLLGRRFRRVFPNRSGRGTFW